MSEHGTGKSIFYRECPCDICRSKKQAVERLIDSFSQLPAHWLEKISPGTPLPMWGTVFLPKDSCDTRQIGQLLKPIEDKSDDLYGSDWQDVADTGINAIEIDGELLLGINGAGYSFYAEHWLKLYDTLGYGWHDSPLS